MGAFITADFVIHFCKGCSGTANGATLPSALEPLGKRLAAPHSCHQRMQPRWQREKIVDSSEKIKGREGEGMGSSGEGLGGTLQLSHTSYPVSQPGPTPFFSFSDLCLQNI